MQITLTFTFQWFHWHTATPTCLHTVAVWCYSSSSCDRLCTSAKARTLTIQPFREKAGQPCGLCHLTDCSYQDEEETVPPAGHKVSAFHRGGFSPAHP